MRVIESALKAHWRAHTECIMCVELYPGVVTCRRGRAAKPHDPTMHDPDPPPAAHSPPRRTRQTQSPAGSGTPRAHVFHPRVSPRGTRRAAGPRHQRYCKQRVFGTTTGFGLKCAQDRAWTEGSCRSRIGRRHLSAPPQSRAAQCAACDCEDGMSKAFFVGEL